MAQRSGKKTKTAKAEDAIIETVVENTAEAEKKNIVDTISAVYILETYINKNDK